MEGKAKDHTTESSVEKRCGDSELLEASGTSENQATEKSEYKPLQDGECVLEKQQQDKQTDDEDQEEEEEEGAIGSRSSSSSSSSSAIASYRTDSDEELEPREMRPCTVNDPVCAYAECDVHKELCDICHTHCLAPDDSEQRRLHRIVCQRASFFDSQHLIALQQSYDKVCGICIEVVMEKRPREQRFGILPNCKHVFCLKCIRNWRKVNTLTAAVRRGCPVCRTVSLFVCPSFMWVESKKAKRKLIAGYKKACSAIPCKYVQQNDGVCPFRGRCFYQHALDIGTANDSTQPSWDLWDS